ncbi:hypothetical protein FGO68_gene11089 [Halteria grandinella]|uniref:Uncharacterized protein n=1 Tax=Halteria grandinella TaxID=5974 RepID=A0A8J8NYA2_HALGN|nr:hypothetical protein FGO68_gene11089 [Halteria grandinella]
MTDNFPTLHSLLDRFSANENIADCNGAGIISTDGTAHVFSLLGPEEEGGDRSGSWGGFNGVIGGPNPVMGGIRKMTQQVELDEQNRLVPRKPRIRPTQRMIPGFDSASLSQNSQQNAFCLDSGTMNAENSSTASSQRLYSSLPINGTSLLSASSNTIAGVPFSLPMSSLFENRIMQKQNPTGGATSVHSAGSIRSNQSPQRKCATLVPLPFVIKEEVDEENKVFLNPSTVVIPEAAKSSSSSSGTPIAMGSAEAPSKRSIEKPFEMLRKISYEGVPSPSVSQTVKGTSCFTNQGGLSEFANLSINKISEGPSNVPIQHLNVQRNQRGAKGSKGSSKQEAMFSLLEKNNQEDQVTKQESLFKMEQTTTTMPTNVESIVSQNQQGIYTEQAEIVSLASVLQEIQLFDRHFISLEQNGSAISSNIDLLPIQAQATPSTEPKFAANPQQFPKTNFFDMLLSNMGGGIYGQQNRAHPNSWMAGDKYSNQSTREEQGHVLPPKHTQINQMEFEHQMISSHGPSHLDCAQTQN